MSMTKYNPSANSNMLLERKTCIIDLGFKKDRYISWNAHFRTH